MKRIGKLAIGTLMVAGAAFGMATTASADPHVSFGIGVGVPGPYYGHPYYGHTCANPRFRYYHRDYCYRYYNDDYYGTSYPSAGFWITDSYGHRHWHDRGERHGDWNRDRNHGDWNRDRDWNNH